MAVDSDAGAAAAEGKPPMKLGLAIVALMAQAIVMIAVGALLWHWSGRALQVYLTLSVEQVLQGLGLGAGLIALAFALFRSFPRASEKLVRMQADTYASLGPRLSWPAIVAISICAGVGEEALFRGGLQTFLGDYLGAPAAIFLSSVGFALIHLGKPVITLLLFTVGAIFGLGYWLTESLLAMMIGHALYDVWALRYLHKELLRLGLLAIPTDGG